MTDTHRIGFWCRTLKRRDPLLHEYIYAIWNGRDDFDAGYMGEA